MIDASSAEQWRTWIWTARDEAARLCAMARRESMKEKIRGAQRLLDEAEWYLVGHRFHEAYDAIASVGAQLGSIRRVLNEHGPFAEPAQ